jgi:hypothetical protein
LQIIHTEMGANGIRSLSQILWRFRFPFFLALLPPPVHFLNTLAQTDDSGGVNPAFGLCFVSLYFRLTALR